jgi:uncharacterized membrane protein
MADGTTFCGACGAPVGAAGTPAIAPAAPVPPAAAANTGGGLADNMAGALAYLTFIPAIIFLVMEPYNKSRFIRFHAFQCLFFNAAWIVLWIGLIIVHLILAFIPVVGWILSILLTVVVWLGGLVLWGFLVYKAYNNEKFQLPFIGKLAEEQAAK